MEVFVLAPPPDFQITLLICEKCGEAIHLLPRDFTLRGITWKNKSLCDSCMYAIKLRDGWKCNKLSKKVTLREIVIKCDYYKSKEIIKENILRKIMSLIQRIAMAQRCTLF